MTLLATRTLLADLLEQCWQLLIAPHWPRLRDLLQADVQYQTQRLGDYGLERVLSELHPHARWTGHSLIIDAAATERRQLQGAGLLLMPSVFAWPRLVTVTDPPARPTLVYAARESPNSGSQHPPATPTRSAACSARPGPRCWNHSPNQHPPTPWPGGTSLPPAPSPNT